MRRFLPILLTGPVFLFAVQSTASPAPDFDQGVDLRPVIRQALEAAGSKEGPRVTLKWDSSGTDDTVWISISNRDVTALGDNFDFSSRTAVSQNSFISIYELKVSELDILADIMQRNFRRSPGFFAHSTLLSAQQDLEKPPSVMVRDFSIDQGERVVPMLKQVDEAAVVAVIEHLASYKSRHCRTDTGIASSKWVYGHWKNLTAGRSDITVATFRHASFPQESVILTVRGTAEPEKVVVLGGHIDSTAGWGAGNAAPGADDNASGVAVLNEAVRVMVASGYKPKQTLKFIAFAAEEVGLRGSGEIAANFKKEGLAVQGMVNFDMANYKGSAEDIFLISDNTHEGQNAFLGRLVDTYTDYRWAQTACGYGCSDHASWTKNGFIASFPFESRMNEDNPNIHSDRDTLAQTGGRALHAFKFAKLAVAYLVEMAK
ncbi:MAG: M20/M25/M40 family metallo-hydrolase [bacterium]